MHPLTCKVALKEWAVTIEALDRGTQILLLRKGGIREEGKEFAVLHPQFLLYPTYEHQQAELLKYSYRSNLHRVLANAPNPEAITFTHWAQIERVIELSDQAKVARLSPYHIWTDDYAQKRLHWKPRNPLSVLLLRVYRLAEPKRVAYLPQYGGCKSWVPLESEMTLGPLITVLDDREFESSVARIKEALELSPV